MSKHERLIDLCPLFLGLIVLYLVALGSVDGDTLVRVWCLGLILRVITTRATHMPSPICTRRSFKPLVLGGCYDCIFSGHTFTTLLLAHTIASARPCYTHLLFGYSLLSSVFIVASRSHYTIDVLVAWVVYDWLYRVRKA